MANKDKQQMFEDLRSLLREALLQREHGGAYAKLARIHGTVDGYMRAMMDSGMASQRELLALVAATRAETLGPGTRELELEPPSAAVA
jgi:hypothetical protein